MNFYHVKIFLEIMYKTDLLGEDRLRCYEYINKGSSA